MSETRWFCVVERSSRGTLEGAGTGSHHLPACITFAQERPGKPSEGDGGDDTEKPTATRLTHGPVLPDGAEVGPTKKSVAQVVRA